MDANQEVLSRLEARGIQWDWCCTAVQQPVFGYSEKQLSGCVRFWAQVPGVNRYIRVVLKPDGEFLTAHFDRKFRKRVTKRDPLIIGISATSHDVT